MYHQNFVTVRAGLLTAVMALAFGSFAQQYDIYTYDVKTAAVTRVTHVQGSSFNVCWNNNGKKIAHDVLSTAPFPLSQNIFITDLTTGNSSPLIGGEGGNDATWSPNGTTIAFDAWEFDFYYWTYINNLYSVPSGGGPRTLLRQHSSHGSFSPDGSRIAFVDNWFGYIGTRNLVTGMETFVAWGGSWPSWSPNGQYIAFNSPSGGISVVKVDANGNPTAPPLQLTSSGYGPTWSNNSKDLVFIDWPNGDPDVFTIPAIGGTATRLTGRTGGFDMGDYDPALSNNGKFIAWSQFTDTPAEASKGIVGNEVGEMPILLPGSFPNPFTASTTIEFELKKDDHIRLVVYDIMGKEVQQLASGAYKKGTYRKSWNGTNSTGQRMPAGNYLIRLITNGRSLSQMVQLR